MREIRTFELEHGEPASAWRVAQPLAVNVLAGELWLTVEGDAEDYWLAAGESFELKRGALAWLSAGRDGVRPAGHCRNRMNRWGRAPRCHGPCAVRDQAGPAYCPGRGYCFLT